MHEENAKARDKNLEFIFRKVLQETFTEGGYQRRKCGKREGRRQRRSLGPGTRGEGRPGSDETLEYGMFEGREDTGRTKPSGENRAQAMLNVLEI